MAKHYKHQRSAFSPLGALALVLLIIICIVGSFLIFGLSKDKVAPEIKGAEDIDVYIGETASFQENITVTDNQDQAPALHVDSSKVDLTQAGSYELTYTATDKAGNQAKKTILVHVLQKDEIAPEIKGLRDLNVYIGETISYRKNVTVTDNETASPTLTIDSSKVDLTQAGSYPVTYTAADQAGNKTEKTITVTVKKKEQAATSSSDVYALADKKLASLLTDGMTTREKVKAIYNWANTGIWYSGKSNKEDYLSEAQKVLQGGGTDCFGYFAVTKLMFERLNIPNIDVKKVKNHAEDSNHYWSLVSVDGGKTYYHFDATPRKGEGDYFFLVTDEELDAYSDQHDKCHNRDKSLYPATPER